MTLKEKIMDCPDVQGWTNPNISRAENLEKIADNFAVGFAEWCLKFDNLNNEKKYIIEQLLEIYKKEKGL